MIIIRSWLIAPANRHDFLMKFPRIGADCSVIDLEDGTPEQEKVSARAGLASVATRIRQAGLKGSLFVRLNHPGSPHFTADLNAALDADVDGVVIPKLGDVATLRNVGAVVGAAEVRHDRKFQIIGGIESALGVLNVTEIAFGDPHLVALYFGAEDFATDLLGARRTPEGLEVLYARSRIALAAKAARLCAIDQGVLEIRDDQRFTEDSEAARNIGYDGKVCLNPRQVELANRLFSPSEEEIAFSRRLVAAYLESERSGVGTIDFEGRMIDGPLLKRCQRIIQMAESMTSTNPGDQ